MSECETLKDLLDIDLQKLEEIAQSQGWEQIHYDVVSEKQVRML